MLPRLLSRWATKSPHPTSLDEKFPEWGESPYFAVTLKGTIRLKDLLTHLYVLIPVMDDDKHYWVGDAEVEKLLRHGEGWLRKHPERELITNRYLKHQKRLAHEALSQLIAEEEPDADEVAEAHAAKRRPSKSRSVSRSKELGCDRRSSQLRRKAGHRPRLRRRPALARTAEGQNFTEIVGMDVSHRALEIASQKLRLDQCQQCRRNVYV